jgi:hypothetical protein
MPVTLLLPGKVSTVGTVKVGNLKVGVSRAVWHDIPTSELPFDSNIILRKQTAVIAL